MDKEEKTDITPDKRTEEVTDIIERMPEIFAKRITLLACFIVALILFFGYVVRYPDIVTGEVSVSAEQATLQLVASHSGRLRINGIQSQDSIAAGQLLAWTDNPAEPKLVLRIKELVQGISLSAENARALYGQLPKNLHLGDLTVPYSSFLSALRQLADYQEHRLFDKQEQSLAKVLREQQNVLNTLREKELLSQNNLDISDKSMERYRVLLDKKVISQAEFDQALSGRIGAEDQVKSSLRNTASVRQEISSTENSIQQNRIAKQEKELQLDLELLTAFNNLIDKINAWEKQYLIISPIDGQAQFTKFWAENQFVQAGEPIFSIVPQENNVMGKVLLPISGAGKVKEGQEAIVKLADFPYMEYGYVRAVVDNISLVSSRITLGDGMTTDSYLVTITFPQGFVTNYGSILPFKFETKGTAEIITKDRRLIERFFDNLKYIRHSN